LTIRTTSTRIREENESGRSIRRNVLTSYLNVARSALIGIVVTPVFVSRLGQDGFGTWTLVLGATSYILLLEAGLGTAVTTRVSALGGQGDADGITRLVSTALWIACASALLGGAAVIALAASFTDLFHIPAHLSNSGMWAFLIVGLAQVFMLFNTVFAAGIIGAGRFDRISIIGLLTTIAVALAQLGIVLEGGGLVGLALGFCVGTFVTCLAQMAVFRRVVGPIRFNPGAFDRESARALVALSWRNALVGISGSLAYGSDVVIVGAIIGVKAAAGYAVASRAVTFAQSLMTTGANVLTPTYSNAAAMGDRRRLLSIYRLSLLGTLTLALPSAICLAFFGRSLLHLWLGHVPAGATATLAALGVLLVVGLPSYCSFLLLMGTEASGYLLRFGIVSTAINIMASVGATYLLGTPGPAIGSILAALVVDPLLVIGVLRRKLDSGIDVLAPILRAIAVPTVVATATAVSLILLGLATPAVVGGVSAVATAAAFFGSFVLWVPRAGTLSELGIEATPMSIVRSAFARGA
jgi:O-antigen/teichoic acid export membrane protein